VAQFVPIPIPPPDLEACAHKGQAGRLLCLCGSVAMPGAAQLVLRSAQRAGAGLVTLAVFQPEVIKSVSPGAPEATFLDLSRSKALFAERLPKEIDAHLHDVRVAGPGLGTGGSTRALTAALVNSDFKGPLVLDADALTVSATEPADLTACQGPLVITPHPGEATRLLGRPVPQDDAGREEVAKELAATTGSICVLKGAGTVISDGEVVFRNGTGNAGMATAGSGDVLAGILAAYLCCCTEGFTPMDAACAAVFVHGLAGDLACDEKGVRGVVATDLIDFLPAAQKAHLEGARD
jgi:hydroxyethylthiazole kinase-like uncharacterized protein yjeF